MFSFVRLDATAREFESIFARARARAPLWLSLARFLRRVWAPATAARTHGGGAARLVFPGTVSSALTPLRQCRAVYDWAGDAETDLPLKAGDILDVLDDSLPTGWWLAVNLTQKCVVCCACALCMRARLRAWACAWHVVCLCVRVRTRVCVCLCVCASRARLATRTH